jgi:hypothetical protein
MAVKRCFSESCNLVVLLPGGYLYSPDLCLGVAFGFREKSRVQRVGIIIYILRLPIKWEKHPNGLACT